MCMSIYSEQNLSYLSIHGHIASLPFVLQTEKFIKLRVPVFVYFFNKVEDNDKICARSLLKSVFRNKQIYPLKKGWAIIICICTRCFLEISKKHVVYANDILPNLNHHYLRLIDVYAF